MGGLICNGFRYRGCAKPFMIGRACSSHATTAPPVSDYAWFSKDILSSWEHSTTLAGATWGGKPKGGEAKGLVPKARIRHGGETGLTHAKYRP